MWCLGGRVDWMLEEQSWMKQRPGVEYVVRIPSCCYLPTTHELICLLTHATRSSNVGVSGILMATVSTYHCLPYSRYSQSPS